MTVQQPEPKPMPTWAVKPPLPPAGSEAERTACKDLRAFLEYRRTSSPQLHDEWLASRDLDGAFPATSGADPDNPGRSPGTPSEAAWVRPAINRVVNRAELTAYPDHLWIGWEKAMQTVISADQREAIVAQVMEHRRPNDLCRQFGISYDALWLRITTGIRLMVRALLR